MNIRRIISNIPSDIWKHRRNPKLVWPIVIGAIAILYTTGLLNHILYWILFAFIVILSILSGLALVLCRGKHREPPAPRLTLEQQRARNFLERRTKTFNKHYFKKRLVISRDLDKVIQDVIDLCIRDFCLSWFRDIGKDETAFVEILNREMWTIIENLIERLRHVDNLNFLCNEMVFLLYNHFHDLRLSDARKFPGQTTPFLLHPCLKNKETEMKHVRTCAEVLILSLLPSNVTNCAISKYMLREIVAGCLIMPTIESICDPDYINQTLVIYLEDREKIMETEKQKYAYAETYEEFIKMINAATDVEELKRIRYHTIAEIMQATVIHNSKDRSEHDGAPKTSKQNKKDALRERNLKRYINQCRVSKAQCEKRIRNLGGPDYRYFGLGHGQPFQGREKKSKTHHKNRNKSAKVLSFSEILDNSLARSFFMMYMERHHQDNLLRFWISVEKIRLMSLEGQQTSASEVFQEFVTPSAKNVIKFDSVMVRGMEEFIYGLDTIDYFYDAQKIVYDVMEKKFYPEFVLSHDYTEFVCQSESALDEIRAMTGKEDTTFTSIDWSDGFNVQERRNAEALKATMPSNIEERNDYAVRTLQTLDQNINAKTQALELIQRAYSVDSEEQEKLKDEIDQLKTERRHLEFHIERTDLWCEMLGHWKANISSAQYDLVTKVPMFVICVSCDDFTENHLGWVVCRSLEDFKKLHDKIKECCDWMSKDLPISSKKWYKKFGSENLDTLRTSLQEYMTIILSDERLAQSDEIYTFLIPSHPEHIRGQTSSGQSEKSKSPLSFINNIKGSIQNLQFPDILVDAVDADEVDAGIEEHINDRKDSIAEPTYTLIGEIFEIKGVFKILRKTLITFVQVTFGGTINRHLREFVSWLVSEPMTIYYIDNFKQSMWPKGKLAPYPPERTNLEKLRTREQAKEQVMKSIPDVLQHLVGKRNSRLGFIKMFEVVQDFRTNKHFFYMFLELIIFTLCPEIKSKEVLRSLDEKFGNELESTNEMLSPSVMKSFEPNLLPDDDSDYEYQS